MEHIFLSQIVLAKNRKKREINLVCVRAGCAMTFTG